MLFEEAITYFNQEAQNVRDHGDDESGIKIEHLTDLLEGLSKCNNVKTSKVNLDKLVLGLFLYYDNLLRLIQDSHYKRFLPEVRYRYTLTLCLVESLKISYSSLIVRLAYVVNHMTECYSNVSSFKEFLRVYNVMLLNTHKRLTSKIDMPKDEILFILHDKFKTCSDVETQAVIIEIFLRLSDGDLESPMIQNSFPEMRILECSPHKMNSRNLYPLVRMVLNTLNENGSKNKVSVFAKDLIFCNTSIKECKGDIGASGVWLDFDVELRLISFFCEKSLWANLTNIDLKSSTSWEIIRISADTVAETSFVLDGDYMSMTVHVQASSIDMLSSIVHDKYIKLSCRICVYNEEFKKLTTILGNMFNQAFPLSQFSQVLKSTNPESSPVGPMLNTDWDERPRRISGRISTKDYEQHEETKPSSADSSVFGENTILILDDDDDVFEVVPNATKYETRVGRISSQRKSPDLNEEGSCNNHEDEVLSDISDVKISTNLAFPGININKSITPISFYDLLHENLNQSNSSPNYITLRKTYDLKISANYLSSVPDLNISRNEPNITDDENMGSEKSSNTEINNSRQDNEHTASNKGLVVPVASEEHSPASILENISAKYPSSVPDLNISRYESNIIDDENMGSQKSSSTEDVIPIKNSGKDNKQTISKNLIVRVTPCDWLKPSLVVSEKHPSDSIMENNVDENAVENIPDDISLEELREPKTESPINQRQIRLPTIFEETRISSGCLSERSKSVASICETCTSIEETIKLYPRNRKQVDYNEISDVDGTPKKKHKKTKKRKMLSEIQEDKRMRGIAKRCALEQELSMELVKAYGRERRRERSSQASTDSSQVARVRQRNRNFFRDDDDDFNEEIPLSSALQTMYTTTPGSENKLMESNLNVEETSGGSVEQSKFSCYSPPLKVQNKLRENLVASENDNLQEQNHPVTNIPEEFEKTAKGLPIKKNAPKNDSDHLDISCNPRRKVGNDCTNSSTRFKYSEHSNPCNDIQNFEDEDNIAQVNPELNTSDCFDLESQKTAKSSKTVFGIEEVMAIFNTDNQINQENEPNSIPDVSKTEGHYFPRDRFDSISKSGKKRKLFDITDLSYFINCSDSDTEPIRKNQVKKQAPAKKTQKAKKAATKKKARKTSNEIKLDKLFDSLKKRSSNIRKSTKPDTSKVTPKTTYKDHELPPDINAITEQISSNNLPQQTKNINVISNVLLQGSAKNSLNCGVNPSCTKCVEIVSKFYQELTTHLLSSNSGTCLVPNFNEIFQNVRNN